MHVKRKRNWLICYDIADPRRLGRVHRLVSRQAMQVQYSIYLYHGSASDLQDLMSELRKRIHPREDDIRIYTLPRRPELILRGQTLAGESLFLLGEGVAEFGGNTVS